MTNRGLFIATLGVLLLAGGLFALSFPVFLDAYDPWGSQVNCGRGFSADLAQAMVADQTQPAARYVDECNSALAFRRAWTIPLATIGWLILSWLVVAFWRHSRLVSVE
jgi:hypothetical protein